MKKILFCTSSLLETHTGSAVFGQLFLEWANERSIEVDIITPEENKLVESIPFVKHRKVFTKIPILQTFHRSFIYYKTVEQQLARVKASMQSYDLIFFNSVIESLHTAKLVHEAPVWAFLHDENFMNDYKKKPSLKRKWYRYFLKSHEGKAIQFLDRVITNSKYMKLSIEKIYAKHPIHVAYSYFRSYDLPGSQLITEIQDRVNILFIKHDAERGGLSLLVDAITELAHQNISLHIVGADPRYIEKHMSQLKKIKYRYDPYLSRQELDGVFLATDIFCVPSFSEALGLGNLEALQYGKPVIVLDIPISRELLKVESMYFMSNPEDLKKTIMKVINSAEERKSKREAGFRFISESLSKESVFQRWDEIFQ